MMIRVSGTCMACPCITHSPDEATVCIGCITGYMFAEMASTQA